MHFKGMFWEELSCMNKDGHGFFLIHVQKNNHPQTQGKQEKNEEAKKTMNP